jgi:hypothetical protein
MRDLAKDVIDIDDVTDNLAPKFASMFTSLLSVMTVQETKQRARQARQASQASSLPISSASTAGKRRADYPESTNNVKRARTGYTPDDQPTKPINADYSHSTTKSGDSGEYKPEEHSKELVTLMLMDTMTVLAKGFRKIRWQKSGYSVELCQTLTPNAEQC